jgi:hypothetical protein
MLTDKDIQKLTDVFVTKFEFKELKDDVAALKENYQEMHVSVDKILKNLENQEYAVLKLNDTKQDAKLQELAEHTKYTFKTS